MIKGPETKDAIKCIHPGRSVLARLCRLGIAREVVTTGLLNVGTIGLLDVGTIGLLIGVTMVFVRVTPGGRPVVVALVRVTSIGLSVVLVLVRVLVIVGLPGLPIVTGGGGGPLQISPTGQQPPPSQQTVL
jgi:hypothetical protein